MAKAIYGVDFGTGDALAIYGPQGPVAKKDLARPRVAGGKTARDEFIMTARALMQGTEAVPAGSIVVESATIGASGCEVRDVVDLLAEPERNGSKLYTISCRAVKNFRADRGLEWRKGGRYVRDGDAPSPQEIEIWQQPEVHHEDAEIIYRIATESPWRLFLWEPSQAIERIYTSVRPMDKRGYRDEQSEEFMRLLPPFALLPAEMQEAVGVKSGKGWDYSRSLVMPFAMALTEPFLDVGPPEKRRGRFEKVIGAYDRGYPSFYRRMTIEWMQRTAKRMAGVTRMQDVTAAQRKDAWRVTQRQLRWLFHLAQ